MKLRELHAALEARIPKEYACTWDNDGLMCSPDADAEVRRVLCTLDVTDAALLHAAENGFDTVLSHHPLIFRPLGAITPEEHVAKKVLYALQHGISVLSYHTRFDAMPGGMNDLLAETLGLADVQAFGDSESDMGRIGMLPAEIDIYDFCAQIKRALDSDALLLAKAHDTAHRVAVLGGDGKDFICGAIAAGADTYVSGRLSYNTMAEAAEMGITLIEAGHFFTENIICAYYLRLLAELGIPGEYYDSNRIEIV